MRDAGCGMQDAGCRMRDAGCRVRGAGCRMRDAGCGIQEANYLVCDNGECGTDQNYTIAGMSVKIRAIRG